MKINDTIIIGFLVATGVFHGAAAARYVSTLTSAEKKLLLPVAQESACEGDVCEDSPVVIKRAENYKAF